MKELERLEKKKKKNDYHVLLQMNLFLGFRRETKTKATHKLLFTLRR